MPKFTDETRRRLATGWDPRVCTLREYARQNGVSERAVRLWRSQFRREEGSAMPSGIVAVPPQATVAALQARLEDLQATVDALQANLAALRAVLDAAAACLVVPAGTSGSDTAEPEPAVVERKPMPRNGFFWG